MDLDRGTLARIDRKLLAGLGNDEAFRTLRVPATAAKWATWKRYCDVAGVSMGRTVAMLMDRELLNVFGEHTAGEWPVFAQQAVEELETREAEKTKWISMRHGCAKGVSDCDVGRMNLRPERYGLNPFRSLHHVTRRLAPRSGATNAAPAAQG